jgi:hypothetical protein
MVNYNYEIMYLNIQQNNGYLKMKNMILFYFYESYEKII